MQRTFEVWFYIGVMLVVYGLLLGSAGVYQWIHPPSTVLAQKHATFWIGLLLLVAGLAYTIPYWPKQAVGDPHDSSRVG